ncbi:MAG: DUF1573 domain-containing protein [Bacteroidota bacterium]|nr:DUF1573 domain-containing protein [Bacteroidota bacterium]
MKKIVLIATASIFCLNVMGQATKSEGKPKVTKEAVKTPGGDVKTVVTGPTTAATSTDGQPTPDDVMKVNTAKHDFGKIPQGTPVTYSFEIKNTSAKPLVVENTYASCGCTTPEKITEPIAPGATTKLKVQYNAANPGSFTKDVHIKLAGITQEKIVQITGEVVAATQTPAQTPAKPNN